MPIPSLGEVIALVRQRATDHKLTFSLAQSIWLGGGVALALLLLWLVWPRAQAVEIAVIDRGTVRHEVIDEGRTRIHDVFIISAPVGGELQRLEMEPGDNVERGQVVATIAPADPALLDARIAAEANATITAAQAALAAAQANYQLAETNHQRVVALRERDFASAAALDGANAALQAARAAVDARRADVARARAAVSTPSSRARRTTLVRSPASGRVLRVLQESETIAPAGSALIEIGDPSQIEIIAEFLSQDAIQIQAGAPATVENWGGETPLPARVFRIEPYARTRISALGVEEQRVNVILHLDNPENAPSLGHGYRVDARVVLSEQTNVLRVPTDALVRTGRDWAVFVVERGRARLRVIQLGAGGADFRAVVTGLNEYDRVILFPGDSMEDGVAVRALEER